MRPTQSPSTWRFVPMIQASGGVQMAIDAWLFNQCEEGQHPPTLRFYTWWPHALSLGHLQKQWPAKWHNLTYQGQELELVRRPTGGRAVLHQGDLTYALITSASTEKSWGVYENICNFLIQGWKTLGIELHYGSAGRGYIHNPSCFNTATAADLVTADGSKFIGSAQRKGRKTILQHGSMILSTDKDLFQEIFEQSAPWKTSFCNRQEQNDWIIKIVDTLTETAKQYFGIELVTQPFTDKEWQDILKSQYLYEMQHSKVAASPIT
jgi:lipoate-protein ligase A